MYIPDESPDAFGLFVDWLYKGRIPFIASQRHLERLFKLYVFAGNIASKELADQTLDKIMDISAWSSTAKTTLEMVAYVFKNTAADSPLRQWALRDLVWYLGEKGRHGMPSAEEWVEFRRLCRENEDFFEAYLCYLREDWLQEG